MSSAPAPVLALAALALVAILSLDSSGAPRSAPAPAAALVPRTACEGARSALPDALYYELRTAAFPGSGRPDVAVHVPPGFDATRRPGLVVYFHGWNGCVAAALSAGATACGDDGGAAATGADLAAQVDEARVNAIVVAIEARPGLPTGEPGRLAMPAGLRAMLRELFAEHLEGSLGCALDVDALDRVAIVAHSGGYQAAAGALAAGDVPRIAEVDLLDALYGGDDVFLRWMKDRASLFDPRVEGGARFVDLYTCCGGTLEASRALARRAGEVLATAGLARSLYDDDGDAELDPSALARPVVFKRVPREHSALPAAYARALVEASGFARIEADEDTPPYRVPPN